MCRPGEKRSFGAVSFQHTPHRGEQRGRPVTRFPAAERAGSAPPRRSAAFLFCFPFKLLEGLQPANWETIQLLGGR